MSTETADALKELHAVRHNVDAAAEAILAACERALARLHSASVARADGARDVENDLHAIFAACAFQDIVGQRLSRLEALLERRAAWGDDPLLNGPSMTGEGLDQAAADDLFARLEPPGAVHG